MPEAMSLHGRDVGQYKLAMCRLRIDEQHVAAKLYRKGSVMPFL